MPNRRKPYPSDVSDDEWSLVVPYLTLMREDAGQREHSLRELFNGLRYLVRYGIAWRAMPNDLPPWFAVYQQAQRWLAAGSRVACLNIPFRSNIRGAPDLPAATRSKNERPSSVNATWR